MSETPATLMRRIPTAAATVFLGLPGPLAEVVALRCEQAQASRQAPPEGVGRCGPGERYRVSDPLPPLPWVVDRDPVLPEDVASGPYPPGSLGRARRDAVFSLVSRRTPLVVPRAGLHPELPWVHDAIHQVLADDAARTPAARRPDDAMTRGTQGGAPPPGERAVFWEPGEREGMAARAQASSWSEPCEDAMHPGWGRKHKGQNAGGRSRGRTAQSSQGPRGRGVAEGLPAELQAQMDLAVLSVDALAPTEWDLPLAPQTPVLLLVRRASGEVVCLGGCGWAERPCAICLLQEAAELVIRQEAILPVRPPWGGSPPAGAGQGPHPRAAVRQPTRTPGPLPRECVCRLGADPPVPPSAADRAPAPVRPDGRLEGPVPGGTANAVGAPVPRACGPGTRRGTASPGPG